MAGLLQGNTGEIIGGSAAMFLAPSTYPMPHGIADIVNLSSYAANATYGFTALGYTADGIRTSREVSTQETRTDEIGLLKTYPIDYSTTVSGTAKQNSQTNKVRLLQMVAAAANAAGELVTYGEAAPFLSSWRLAVVHEDENKKFHARVYGQAQWDGSAVEESFQRGTNAEIAFSFKCLPTTDCTGPNGQASERVDYDQPA